MNPQLIFIFSLPRSGSTWLQRVITMHPDIATTSELWLLLPLLSATKKQFGIEPYEHDLCLLGIEDALTNSSSTDDWKECYFSGVEAMANKIYSDLAGEHAFFLDKTPRYSLICEEIIQTFPDAKFIFLWRHPFSIVSSIQKTWGKKLWIMPKFYVDLFEGLFNLTNVYKKYNENIYSLQYEELVRNPEETLEKLFSYLGLEYSNSFVGSAQHSYIKGIMGDPNQHRSDGGKAAPDWHKAGIDFCTSRFRKNWLIKYLDCIGAERLFTMGYDLSNSISSINNIEPKIFGINDWYEDKVITLRRWVIAKLGRNKYSRESAYYIGSK